jgi:hypothetical protein
MHENDLAQKLHRLGLVSYAAHLCRVDAFVATKKIFQTDATTILT